MDLEAQPIGPGLSQKTGTLLADNKRRAHRVFYQPGGWDVFNPFRHIPWFESRKDHRRTVKKPQMSLFGFEYKRFSPSEPAYEAFTFTNQFQRTMLTSWVNVLLLCVPAGIALSHVRGGAPETFVLNYLAQFPLWFLCDYALEEMEKYIGVTLADLLDIFTTNTVQIISAVLLLLDKKVDLLQTSLVGGILSNILVLLGLSISVGGAANIDQRQQAFNRTGAQGSSSLLSIAATSLLIPTAVKLLGQTSSQNLVRQSRGVAVVLLFVYFAYSACQMWTHKQEYRASGKSSAAASAIQSATINGMSVGKPPSRRRNMEKDDKEIHGPQLDLPVAALLFTATIASLYSCIDGTINSISALTENTPLGDTFVGLILLPIPNCDFAPISLAIDDQLEQTMKYTVGRSIQTALLVEPFVVLLAWGLHVPDVTLAFNGFEVVSLFTTILLLNFLVVDAKVHWVHGILLLADWVLIGIAAYFVN